MADCSSCPSRGKCTSDKSACSVKINPANNIKNIIGVMSGKGGVGKSTVSALLAKTLARKGYKVGLLDADVMGPSATKLFGISGQRAYASDGNIIPVEDINGIKIVSLNLMLDDENKPVVWRGSLLSSCVTQFWTDTLWEELDYLIIDMPPGTGDITLTIMQTIPLTGLIIVTTAQDMVEMIVNKSINMAKTLKINIIGIVKNFSYILCPHCNEKIEMFKSSGAADTLDVPVIAELPMQIELASFDEHGIVLNENSDTAKTFNEIARTVEKSNEGQ